ncbi:MAG: c-type cytochrome [Niabella sp.]
MKKLILLTSLMYLLSACGGGSSSSNEAPEQKSSPKSMLDNTEAKLATLPDYQPGHDLVDKYMCATCHKVDDKLTGPAYKDVAQKYAGADESVIKNLAKKIIDGGSGVWGELPMTPHPNVSEEDAKAMVKYILLLK